MKFTIARYIVVLGFLIRFSLYGDSVDRELVQESSYDLILVVLEQGHVRLERHPLWHELRGDQNIFTLNLSDSHDIYTTILCNSDTNGLIVIRSNNDAMYDYCLNWGAMVGFDVPQSYVTAFVPVIIKNDAQERSRLMISGMIENKKFDLEISTQLPVKSACAVVLPTALVQTMITAPEIMSLSEACRLGVVVTKGRNDLIADSSCEREIEFDRILDSMIQDGTIRVKPVSPFMAKLRTIGSTIFIKYLAVKNVIRSWWHSWWRPYNATDVSEKRIIHIK